MGFVWSWKSALRGMGIDEGTRGEVGQQPFNEVGEERPLCIFVQRLTAGGTAVNSQRKEVF